MGCTVTRFFSSVILTDMARSGLSTNCPTWVSTCYYNIYNNSLEVYQFFSPSLKSVLSFSVCGNEKNHALSPPLESVLFFFFCGNKKMWPPPWVELNFDLSLLLLLVSVVNLNPGRGVHKPRLGTDNVHFMWEKIPSPLYMTPCPVKLSTWILQRRGWPQGEPQQIWLKWKQGFFLQKPSAQRRWGGVGLFISWSSSFYLPTNFPRPGCLAKQGFESICGKLECAQSCLNILNNIVHLVLLLLSSVDKIYCSRSINQSNFYSTNIPVRWLCTKPTGQDNVPHHQLHN